MRRLHWLRVVTLAVFIGFFILGTSFFFFDRGGRISSFRRASWENAIEWWQGMAGARLTHHRAGFQVAYMNPETGRLTAVWDLIANVDGVEPKLRALPDGEWFVLTMLEPGITDGPVSVVNLLRQAGWSGDISPAANAGAAIFILSRTADHDRFAIMSAQAGGEQNQLVTLQAGLIGKDGATLRRSFVVQVKPPYD
jgi:hypothetical protein